MENIQFIKFTQFFNYCADNQNKIKGPSKIRVKKGTS